MQWCNRWAAGVLIFEMAAGYPPFYNEDRVAMFRNICQVKYTCPPHFSKVQTAELWWLLQLSCECFILIAESQC